MIKMIIAVTGTPGTGKTTLSKELALKMNLEYIDVNEIINSNKKIILENDEKRQTCIVDDALLMNILEKKVLEFRKKGRKKFSGLLIDSHISHMLDSKFIDVCIVLSCDLKELKNRLISRKYNKLKIKENLEVEAFDEILEEAKSYGHNILNLRTENGYNIEEIIKEIRNKK